MKLLNDAEKRSRTISFLEETASETGRSWLRNGKPGLALAKYGLLVKKQDALQNYAQSELSKGKCLSTILGLEFGLEIIESGLLADYGLQSKNFSTFGLF